MLKLKEMFTKEKIFTKRNIIIAIVTLLTIALAVTGFCIWKGNSGKKGFNSRPDFESINKTHSTALAAPKDGSTPFNYDPNKNAYYAFGVMNETDSFVGRGEGVTATKVGFANVNQYIKSHRVVNEGEVYKESVSFSKFKGVGVRTFVKGDNYVIHKAAKVSSVNNVTWKDEASKVTQEAFLQAYGVVPNSITAYILTDETILSAEYLGEDNGIYSYKYKLEPSKSTVKIALEMRSMAGVKSLPLFTDVNLIIRMDKNWRVTETVTDCTYDVDMLGGVTCTEKLTEVFTDYEKEVEIPDLEFYHSYLDAEITEPTEKEETALDYLMGGFGDYITGGKPLKVRLLAEGNESLPLSLAGNAEIKIDMEDLSATSARVDVDNLSYGDIALSDLFIGYGKERVYLALDDFKAYGSIDEMGAVIGRLLPIFGVEGDLGSSFASMDLNGILENATLTKDGENATVSMPIDLGGMHIDAQLKFKQTDTKITFVEGNVSVAGVAVTLAIDDSISVAEIGQDYHNIAPLFDLIDEDGRINLEVALGEINALVNFDVKSLSADIGLGDLTARYAQENLYLNYNGLKAKLALADINPMFAKLKPIIENFVDLSALETLGGTVDVLGIVGQAVNELHIEEKDNVLTISTSIEGVAAAINLAVTEEGYTIKSVDVTVKETTVSLAPTDKTFAAITEEEQVNYKSIATLLDIIDENGSVRLDVNVGEINALVDFNLHTLVADVNLDDLVAKYADETLYLNYKGLKAKLAIADVEPTFAKLKPIISNFADLSALETLGEGMDVTSLLGTALNELTITEAEDVVTISTTVEGVSVALNLTIVNDGYTIQSIELNVKDTAITVAPTDKTVTAIPEEEQVNYRSIATILDIIDENGSVRLDVNVGEINALVDFNLHTLVADVNLDDLVAKYADETLYLNYKGLKAKLAIADVEPTFAKLKPIISNFADLSALETLGEGMDVASLL
ncbi:MAG: hypothetical protein IKA20_00005, partial [Clostridia bacterium]|nr:hypothetical protein [Clostridia bacterium]